MDNVSARILSVFVDPIAFCCVWLTDLVHRGARNLSTNHNENAIGYSFQTEFVRKKG